VQFKARGCDTTPDGPRTCRAADTRFQTEWPPHLNHAMLPLDSLPILNCNAPKHKFVDLQP